MKEFEQFRASLLFCPRCRKAVPVRERLLLILPDGKLFDYMCAYCASSIGSRAVLALSEAKKETEKKEVEIII